MRQGDQDAVDDVAAGLVEVHVLQRRVVGAAPGEQHVVDGTGHIGEEPFELSEIGGVEGGRVPGADLGGGGLQPIGPAGGEDDVGALRPGQAGRLQADPRAPADHDHRLAGQRAQRRGFSLRAGGGAGHGSSQGRGGGACRQRRARGLCRPARHMRCSSHVCSSEWWRGGSDRCGRLHRRARRAGPARARLPGASVRPQRQRRQPGRLPQGHEPVRLRSPHAPRGRPRPARLLRRDLPRRRRRPPRVPRQHL